MKVEPNRPNPDELLEQVQAQERQSRRGHLKIFFGACAGIGKTYTMLEAARHQMSNHIDVAIGYVEPHTRPDTIALLEGLEQLPLKKLFYRGKDLTEFNLDAALERKASLLIVDELAHSNAPGSRHVKRWQDVMELLEAGINVYTTLNVQHLETFNDMVGQFSGVRVRETVPDTIFDQADEVELVDLPPDELLQRMAEGKIYVPDRASKAMQNFFQKGNLVALRELALRRTAERVNVQAEAYRHPGMISPTAERLMVCVGPSPFSARVIRSAARMAGSLHAPWLAVSVETSGTSGMSQEAQDRLWANQRMAGLLGAETVTLAGANPAQEILAYARARNVNRIIVGKPAHPRWQDWIYGSLVYDLIRQCGPIDIYVITGESGSSPRPMQVTRRRPVPWWIYGLAILTVAICTLLGLILPGLNQSNVVMIYLLGVIAVALIGRRGPAVLASLLSAFAYNFFFIPPLYTLALASPWYWVTVAALALTGVIISTLVVRIRGQTDAARQRELRTTTLYALSKELASAGTIEQVARQARNHLKGILQNQVVVLLTDAEGRLSHAPNSNDETLLSTLQNQDGAVAQWVYEHNQMAGFGTDTLPSSRWLFVPLPGSSTCLGVIGLQPQNQRALSPEQMQMLTTLAVLIAGALDRILLTDKVRRTQVEVEAEKMRGTLLSSVSHDLRTPLTTIIGAAETLAESEQTLTAPVRKELLETITSEAERINHLVGNLLDMTRLESGQTTLQKEWLPVEEVIGAALQRSAKILNRHKVKLHLPAVLPMLHADSLLIEQVLVNLLENAAKYSPADSQIEISARAETSELIIDVADRGPGVPDNQRQRIFEKFVRGRDTRGTPGVGLGLAICREIMAVHGGRIGVEERPGGGAIFRIALPREPEPPITEEDDAP
jgi:two-component system, OmpR family, sensor histidine kinase KdpD